MSRSPRSTAARSHGSARSAVPISSSICSARLGAPPCSGPGERADRADDRGAEVGAGRRDHARGERRRVEAVVDRGDEVLLDRGRVLGRRLLALHHVEVVRGVARGRRAARPARGPGAAATARRSAWARPRTSTSRCRAASRASTSMRRPEAERRAVLRDRGAQRVERHERVARARRSRAARRRPRRGSRGAARMSAANASRSASVVGQPARRTAGTRRLRAGATSRGRPRCTGGSGRSLRGRARRRRSCRRRRRLRGPSAPRAPARRRAGSSRRA